MLYEHACGDVTLNLFVLLQEQWQKCRLKFLETISKLLRSLQESMMWRGGHISIGLAAVSGLEGLKVEAVRFPWVAKQWRSLTDLCSHVDINSRYEKTLVV